MAKDAWKNQPNYKIGGGQLNEFEFNRQHGALSEQEKRSHLPGQTQGEGATPELPWDEDASASSPEAERVSRLLEQHGTKKTVGSKRTGGKKSAAKKAGAKKSGAKRPGAAKKSAGKRAAKGAKKGDASKKRGVKGAVKRGASGAKRGAAGKGGAKKAGAKKVGTRKR